MQNKGQVCIGTVYKYVQSLLSHILNHTIIRGQYFPMGKTIYIIFIYIILYRCAKRKNLCTKPLPLLECYYQERNKYLFG